MHVPCKHQLWCLSHCPYVSIHCFYSIEPHLYIFVLFYALLGPRCPNKLLNWIVYGWFLKVLTPIKCIYQWDHRHSRELPRLNDSLRRDIIGDQWDIHPVIYYLAIINLSNVKEVGHISNNITRRVECLLYLRSEIRSKIKKRFFKK